MRKPLMVAMIVGAMAISAAGAGAAVIVFSDTVEHPRAADIAFAAQQGWVSGYPDGSFKPDRAITPRQMSTILSNAFGPDGMTRAEFATFVKAGFGALQPHAREDLCEAEKQAKRAVYEKELRDHFHPLFRSLQYQIDNAATPAEAHQLREIRDHARWQYNQAHEMMPQLLAAVKTKCLEQG